MKKELVSAGKPYVSVLYFSILALTAIMFVTSFRSVPVGMIFLTVLVIKLYTGSEFLIYLACSYLFKQKPLLTKAQIKTSAIIAGCLLLVDGCAFFYLPDLARLNYTSVSFLLFLLISGQCLAGKRKKDFAYSSQ